MTTLRPILPHEKDLITHLLTLAKAEHLIASIPAQVSPYNMQQPESINLSGTDAEDYASDIITVAYFDADGIRVIISLTQNDQNELLDMDFWKEDFADLVAYPKPEQVATLD